MQKLVDLKRETEVNSGTTVRLYNVRRFDIMKNHENLSDIGKREKDFYDYILVDIGIVNQGTFLLVNITSDNNNKGSILCAFENVESKGWVKAEIIKDYFDDSPDVFLILNTI